jgi:hypothetical protein
MELEHRRDRGLGPRLGDLLELVELGLRRLDEFLPPLHARGRRARPSLRRRA